MTREARVVSFCADSGKSAVTFSDGDKCTRHHHEPVIGWLTLEDDDGVYVVAAVPDGNRAIPADPIAYIAPDEELVCRCSAPVGYDAEPLAYIDWCTRCGGWVQRPTLTRRQHTFQASA